MMAITFLSVVQLRNVITHTYYLIQPCLRTSEHEAFYVHHMGKNHALKVPWPHPDVWKKNAGNIRAPWHVVAHWHAVGCAHDPR